MDRPSFSRQEDGMWATGSGDVRLARVRRPASWVTAPGPSFNTCRKLIYDQSLLRPWLEASKAPASGGGCRAPAGPRQRGRRRRSSRHRTPRATVAAKAATRRGSVSGRDGTFTLTELAGIEPAEGSPGGSREATAQRAQHADQRLIPQASSLQGMRIPRSTTAPVYWRCQIGAVGHRCQTPSIAVSRPERIASVKAW